MDGMTRLSLMVCLGNMRVRNELRGDEDILRNGAPGRTNRIRLRAIPTPLGLSGYSSFGKSVAPF